MKIVTMMSLPPRTSVINKSNSSMYKILTHLVRAGEVACWCSLSERLGVDGLFNCRRTHISETFPLNGGGLKSELSDSSNIFLFRIKDFRYK